MTAFLTNKGAESGSILPWVKTSGSGILIISTDLPRSGVNSFRFSPGGTGGGIGVTVTHTITDADLVAAMVGQVVNFVIWVAIENLFFGGGHSGSNYRFRVRDDVGNGDWVNMFSGASPVGEVDNTYRQFVATRTIDASATVVYLDLAYFKAGTESAYKFYNDDLGMWAGGIAGVAGSGVIGGVIIQPADAITRVTSLKHIYNREAGIFDLEIGLGEVAADFAVPAVDLVSKSASSSENKEKEIDGIKTEVLREIIKEEPIGIPREVIPGIPKVEFPKDVLRGLPRDTELPPIVKPGELPKLEGPKDFIEGVPKEEPSEPIIKTGRVTISPVRTGTITDTQQGVDRLARERQRMRELQEQGLSREEINRIIAEQ